jgi:ABC-2 type transport system ATP-binding protein
MTAAVHVEQVTKRFGTTVALDALSFDVQGGELFGFIGPDGAGKTTLFRILATLLLPTSGSATVLGQDTKKDLWALRPRLGYMAGRFSLYPDLSVEENLRFYASVFDTTVAAEYERIRPIYSQLEPFRTRRAGALSGGMKQKLALCCALVHRPELLLLDEPTTGVDAVSRREFWDLLGDLRLSGLTIVVSTPYMDEANRCDRVALIDGGHILATDTPAALTAGFGRPLLAVYTDERYRTLLALREYEHAHTVFPFGESIHYTDVRRELGAAQLRAELDAFLASRSLPARILTAEPSIEDAFMERLS